MHLATLYATTASQGDDLQALRQEACRTAADGLEAGHAKFLAYDAGEQDFLVMAGVGLQPGVVGLSRSEADTGIAAGYAWHTGELVISNDLGPGTRFRVPGLRAGHRLAKSISVPVRGLGGLLGILDVERPGDEDFSADDACFVQLLAHSLGAAADRLGQRALRDQQAARSVDDHELLLHEMHHRVRNDLQGICSSISRESRRAAGPEQRAGYDRVSRRVTALAGLYDHLLGLQSSRMVEMGAYLSSLCARIAAAGEFASRGITLDAATQPVDMTIGRAARLAIAVNELVANAADHAFPDDRAGRIVIRLVAGTADGAGRPVVTVSDDGCGFDGLRPGGAGLGFVDQLVRGAGGALTRVDGSGTEWQIALAP